jgi:hypothetical protein
VRADLKTVVVPNFEAGVNQPENLAMVSTRLDFLVSSRAIRSVVRTWSAYRLGVTYLDQSHLPFRLACECVPGVPVLRRGTFTVDTVAEAFPRTDG